MTSATGQPQEKKHKPGTFVKGDPRINRKGTIKPRAQKELEALLDEIFDEELTVTSNDGKAEKMTELKAALKRLLRSKNIGGVTYAIDRRFGKIQDQTEHSGEVKVIIEYDNGTDGN